MAEYNVQYLSLKKRLTTIKAKLAYMTLNNTRGSDSLNYFLQKVENLSKDLDIKYDENRSLDHIEIEINNLENSL